VVVPGADATALDDIARIAQVHADETSADDVIARVVELVTRRCAQCDGAALTVDTGGEHTFGASCGEIDQIHRVQFGVHAGPVVEVLDNGEPRRVDDVASEKRWPDFAAVTSAAGFRSCLVLPVRTDRSRAGALALYSCTVSAFTESSHDLALLLAAQAGVAVDNHAVYAVAQRAVANLQEALQTRAVIEQAKAIIAVQHGIGLDDAFSLLSAQSQREQRRLSDVARSFVDDRISTTNVV
jgi:GAF domain-containing protein